MFVTLVLTTSLSGIDIGLPVLNEVSTPLRVIGAEGSAPSVEIAGAASGPKYITSIKIENTQKL